METLVEYLTYVKGIGYVLVVAFLFAFITFWILVHTKNNEIVKNVPIVVMIWLVFGAASALISNANNTNGYNQTAGDVVHESNQGVVYSEFYVNGSPATTVAHRTDKRLGVNKTEYSSISYGSATNFHEIMSNELYCKDCHHNSGVEVRPCKDCHNAPFDPKEVGKPGLKAAIHGKCIECHRPDFEGPQACKVCHTTDAQATVEIQVPARNHELKWENCSGCHTSGIPGGGETKIVYHDFCLRCHTASISGATKMPENHAGRTADTCKGCHKPAGGVLI